MMARSHCSIACTPTSAPRSPGCTRRRPVPPPATPRAGRTTSAAPSSSSTEPARRASSARPRLCCPPRRDRSELEHHPGVSEDVGLHVLESEELGDTFVVRAQQLLVDHRLNRRAVELAKPVPGEELDL